MSFLVFEVLCDLFPFPTFQPNLLEGKQGLSVRRGFVLLFVRVVLCFFCKVCVLSFSQALMHDLVMIPLLNRSK